jgi:hypothetical protein
MCAYKQSQFEAFLGKQTLAKQFFFRPSTMPREHDRPDPNLIIQGGRRVQPSKRGLGNDYPVTPLEELRERDKSKWMTVKKSVFKTYITYNIKDDSVLFQVDNADRMEEGSSGVGSLGDTERILKDRNMPDGDACRPDGTLKDASEMEWPDSPSEVQANLPEPSDDDYSVLNLKRSLPRDDSDEEESGSADERKVSIPIVRQIIKYLPVLN